MKAWLKQIFSPQPQEKAVEFLPDADEIERTPIARGIPVTLYSLLALFVLMVLWAAFAQVDMVVSTKGRLVSTTPNIVIQPIETAQIDSLDVTVGQVVRKGQVLATLDPTVVGADVSQLRDRLKSLEAQADRLRAEIDGKAFGGRSNPHESLQGSLDLEKLAGQRARLLRFDENISRLKSSISSNAVEIVSLERRYQSLKEIEGMNEQLVEKQFQSRRALLESRDKRLEVERELVSLRNRANEMQRELAGAEADKSAFIKETRQKALEELVSVQREKDSLSEQLVKADRRTRFISIEAPVDSVVLEVAKRSKGSVIREAENFITLVPADAPLEAEIRINAAEIATVATGDSVRVKIDAFPFQKHGLILGKLTKLSQDTVNSEESIKGISSAYYLARVDLGEVKLNNLDKPLRLMPGMSVAGEIIVGKRSILSYLIYPIIQTQNEALNER
jgi:HlyD family secretion protein